MARPIVILAFANDPDAALPHLQEEAKHLSKLFHKLQDQGLVDLRYYPHTTFEQLAEDLRSLQKNVLIFHFGGHASSDNIGLPSSPFRLEKIADLIVEYWKPTLVFLNGCSTSKMAKSLIGAGVKGVIATERPVNDRSAKDFAINFYEGLLESKSVKQSFDLAKALFKADGREHKNMRFPIGRNLNIPVQEEGGFPWNLDGKRVHGFRLDRFFRYKQWRASISKNWKFIEVFAAGCFIVSFLVWRFSNTELEQKKPGTDVIFPENWGSFQPPSLSDEGSKPPIARKAILYITDQTGTPVEFSEESSINIVSNDKEHIPVIQDSEKKQFLEQELMIGSRIYLEKDGKAISNPKEKWSFHSNSGNGLDTFKIQVQRLVLRINANNLEEDGLDKPDSLSLISKANDTLRVPLNWSDEPENKFILFLPFRFYSDTTLIPWVPPPLRVRTDSCMLMKKPAYRDTPCSIRFELIES